MNGIEKVLNVLNGKANEVQPCFDIIRNDSIIEYYSGEKLTEENAPRLVGIAASRALDGTRGILRIPMPEREEILSDGRKSITYRWTNWVEKVKYRDIEHYIEEKSRIIKGDLITENDKITFNKLVDIHFSIQDTYLNDRAYFWQLGGYLSSSFAQVYNEIGLEEFSYIYADSPGIIVDLVNFNLERAVKMVDMIPEDKKPFGIFYADDMAFKSGPLINPSFFTKGYYEGLKKLVDAIHKRGMYVMFHSDGCLYEMLDAIVDTGIDFLNPIEIKAGMDVKKIHERYPKLVMAGGIDASELLVYGKPEDVKKAVRKAIEDSDGKILVGSSTELHNDIPLENFLALKSALVNKTF